MTDNTIQPITPWIRWLGIATYWFMAVVLVSAGPHDLQAFGMGLGMVALGGTWAYVGTQKISRGIEWITEALGQAIAGTIVTAFTIAVPLVTLYFLVRFVKWAWMND